VSVLTAEHLLAGAGATHRIRIPDAVAPPAWAEGGGEPEIVLRPLVLADVVRLHRASREDGDLCSALIVQQALVDPVLSLEQVHRLPAGLAEFLLAEVNRVSGLTLTGDDLDALVHEPLARACLVLAREFGWTPDRCAELTVGQVLTYLQLIGREGARPS
jgi:hypothetical protein